MVSPLVILALPLIGGLVLTLFRSFIPEPWGGWIASVAVKIAALLVGISLFYFNGQPVTTFGFSWFHFDSFSVSFSFLYDSLSLTMAAIVTGVGALIHVYSIGYMKGDKDFNRFFAILNFFIFFMLILVLSDSYLLTFAGWEGVGVCSYLLIGFWYDSFANTQAAKKAFLINRIGDVSFLIGIFLLIFFCHSAQFSQVFANSVGIDGIWLTIITLCLLGGAMGKSAQFPLHTWLPDAMAGPTPVSALIHAATMVTAGVYLMCRSWPLLVHAPITREVMLVLGAITSLWGALVALKQTDIKKVLAFSTLSQLGLLFVALGLGAYTSALFHLTTHAFFKALLFLTAGNVIHALHGEQNILKMGGLRKTLPVTYVLFGIGVLAISGLPPLAGFMSKDLILYNSLMVSPWLFGFTILISILTAVYMFRLLALVFWKEAKTDGAHEASWVMQTPLMVLAALSVLGGFIPVIPFLKLTVSDLIHGHGSGQFVMSMTVGTVAILATIAFWAYRWVSAETDKSIVVLQEQFYIDTIYAKSITNPLALVANTLEQRLDNQVIETAFTKTAGSFFQIGFMIRKLQAGLGSALLVMALGLIAMLIFMWSLL